MHINKRVFLLIICIAILSFTLTGCYDLGNGTVNDEDYCDVYSEVSVIDGLSNITYYSMEDFYNKEAVNDFKSPMSESERSYYTYLLIQVERDLSIGNIAVHFESTVEETLSVSFFILDEDDIPTKVFIGDGEKYSEGECDEPNPSSALGHETCHLRGTANKWDAILLTSWNDGETVSKRHDISEGLYIVLRIDNNCYDRAKLEYDHAQKEWQAIVEDYEQKMEAWQTVNNNPSATQEEKDAAMKALSEATAAKNLGERDFGEAQKKYERNKFPYKAVPIRITAILINAE